MRILRFVAFLLCLIPLALVAQPWMRPPYLLKQKGEADFKEISAAFYSYWQFAPTEKGKGYKQFKRWEYINEPRAFPDGRIKSVYSFYEAKEAIKAQNAIEGTRVDYSNWVPIGLTNWVNGPNGYNPGNGRVNVVTSDSAASQVIYVGTPSGGLWKSVNGGQNWNTTFDILPQLGVSAIAIHPDSSQVIFIGTGDRDAFDTQCIGIYKSIDGGNTWAPSGINFMNPWNSINKIIFNPLNPKVMLAATNYDVYRSANGGQSWSSVYNGSSVTDLKYLPGDTNVIYGSGGFFIRSIDGGSTFVANTVLPNDTCRLEIAVTPADPGRVYVLSSDADNTFGGLYRSLDSGFTFTLMSDTPNVFGYAMDGSDDSGQGWYDIAVAASPVNADEVFIGGVNVWKSDNGGQSWAISSHWVYDNPSSYTHADIHYLGFSGQRLFCGSDGGVFYSDDYGDHWNDISEGLGISQIYRMASSVIDPDFIVCGMQDNGSNKLENGVWSHIFGADGMQTLTDPTDINIFYFSYQAGGIMRTYDNGATIEYIQPNDSINGAWITPYVMHPQDNNTLFAGYDDVYKTLNGGFSWDKISDSLTGGGTISHLKVALSNPDYIYASRQEKLYVTKNGGLTWTSGSVPFTGKITDMAIDSYNPERIWITASGNTGDRVYVSTNAGQTYTNMTYNLSGTGVRCLVYRKDAHEALYVGTETAVFYIDSTLTQWEPFFTGLPNVIISDLEINEQAQKIRAATYGRGVWESPLMPVSGINTPKAPLPYSLYPNPSDGMVYLDFKDNNTHTVTVFDVNGRCVRNRPAYRENSMVLDLRQLVSGVYFVRIVNGGRTFIERVMLYN